MKNKMIYLLFISLLIMTSCKTKNHSFTIAMQYGLAYAPLQIMKEKGILEKAMPHTEIQWVKLANTAAIREAVLAGDVDAGFLGIPPFLIAQDQGMPWKMLCGLSRAPLGLVVPAGKWDSLKDIPPDSKIALPQPGSIQHILLTMALDRELDDPSYLDKNLVSLKHPDGMNALFSKAVDGHFTSPPYLFQESDSPDFEVLLSGEDAMGENFTFIISMITNKAVERNPESPQQLKKALDESIQFMDKHPVQSSQILAEAFSLEQETMADYLRRPGLVFETNVTGLETFIRFMRKAGYIKNIEKAEDVLLP